MNEQALNWLHQAQNDLEFAELASREKFYSQCCFLCQQAGEKALKSLAYYRGAFVIKGHSIAKIAKDLNFNGEIEIAAKVLDTFYISSRYPDALPGGAPFQSFVEIQATQAIELATLIINRVDLEVIKK